MDRIISTVLTLIDIIIPILLYNVYCTVAEEFVTDGGE